MTPAVKTLAEQIYVGLAARLMSQPGASTDKLDPAALAHACFLLAESFERATAQREIETDPNAKVAYDVQLSDLTKWDVK